MPFSKYHIATTIQTIIQKDDKNAGELFLNAIYNNNITRARELLTQDPESLNFQADHGFAALHIAAFLNHSEIITWLLSYNHIIPGIRVDGLTALHCAIIGEAVDATRIITAANKIDIEATDENNLTSMHYAALSNNREQIDTLLSAHANINAQDATSMTPLHYAAINGLENALAALLESKLPEINSVMEHNRTALYMAAIEGHASSVNLLLSHGANPNIPDDNNQLPIHLAAANGNLDMVQTLLSSNSTEANILLNGKTPLLYALERDQHDVAIEMLKYPKVNPNLKGAGGATALHLAVFSKAPAVVEALLVRPDIDIDVKINEVTEILVYGILHNDIELIDKILLLYPKINLSTPSNSNTASPLARAFWSNNDDIFVKILNSSLDSVVTRYSPIAQYI